MLWTTIHLTRMNTKRLLALIIRRRVKPDGGGSYLVCKRILLIRQLKKHRSCDSILDENIEKLKHAASEERIVCREKLKGITGIRASSEQWRQNFAHIENILILTMSI